MLEATRINSDELLPWNMRKIIELTEDQKHHLFSTLAWDPTLT